MAKNELAEPREIVKANNDLFRCKYNFKDVVAGRIFMAFASLVDENDVKENQNFVEYQIGAGSILPDKCDGGDNYKQLQDAAFTLLKHTIAQKIGKRGFRAYTLFSMIEYNNGIIKGQFHKDLVPFFITAREKFTRLKLDEYINLPTIYDQCIFGFLKSWSDKNEIIVNVNDLHDILDAPDSIRKNFAEFNRRVLNKAHKDISALTTLRYEYEPIKNGRSYIQIKFKFIKKLKKSTQQAEIDNSEHDAPIHDQFLKFMRNFKTSGIFQAQAWKVWQALHESGNAPLAKDVSDENTLSVMDFLKQWQAGK